MSKSKNNKMTDSSNTDGDYLTATEASIKKKLLICWKMKMTPTFLFADEWSKYQQMMDVCVNEHNLDISGKGSEIFSNICDKFMKSLRSYELCENNVELN